MDHPDRRDDLPIRLLGAAGVLVAALVAGVAIALLAVDLLFALRLAECDELECLTPPLVAAVVGFAAGLVAGVVLGVVLVRRRRWAVLAWTAGVAAAAAVALVLAGRLG